MSQGDEMEKPTVLCGLCWGETLFCHKPQLCHFRQSLHLPGLQLHYAMDDGDDEDDEDDEDEEKKEKAEAVKACARLST